MFTVIIIGEDEEFADAVLQVFAGVVDELVLRPGDKIKGLVSRQHRNLGYG